MSKAARHREAAQGDQGWSSGGLMKSMAKLRLRSASLARKMSDKRHFSLSITALAFLAYSFLY